MMYKDAGLAGGGANIKRHAGRDPASIETLAEIDSGSSPE